MRGRGGERDRAAIMSLSSKGDVGVVGKEKRDLEERDLDQVQFAAEFFGSVSMLRGTARQAHTECCRARIVAEVKGQKQQSNDRSITWREAAKLDMNQSREAHDASGRRMDEHGRNAPSRSGRQCNQLKSNRWKACEMRVE